jgi:ethanolamine ammonia-lyase small subunit
MIDRSKIEALVRQALGAAEAERATVDAHGALLLRPDRGVNLDEPFDAAAMREMLGATPARIAVGRAGTRYKTNTLLRFRADHAAAKDAVMSEVDDALIGKLGLLALRSRAESKAHFLQRPDAGRALSDESRALVGEKLPRGAEVLLVYGDGLSAAALNTHLEPFHQALSRELAARGVRVGGACFVRHSRVKVMDEICRIADAQACIFVCGERPGLGFADSLSAYYIYRPPSGTPTDADREVISNINPRGLDVAKAAVAVADACQRILREKKSGVVIG